jgi:hypothetical protein
MDFTGIIDALRQLFQDFHAGIYVGVAAILYLVINVLRGKAGFSVPFITKLWNKIESKAIKTYILLGLFGVAGGLLTLGSTESDIWLFLDGFLAGIGMGIGTLGLRQAAKTTLETESVKALTSKMKDIIKKKKDEKTNENKS